MRPPGRLSILLRSGGLFLHKALGLVFGIGFTAQCWTLGVLAALLLITGSALDQTFILPGRSLGFLEHPAIWAFIGLQVALPLSLRRSLARVLFARRRLRELASHHAEASTSVVHTVLEFSRLQTPLSKAIAGVVFSLGLAAFVWNTYQNQLPGTLLPFDFWDSKLHFWGFWLTRAYKFYLFVVLLPYIGLVHIAVLAVTLGNIRRARLAGTFHLIPFHDDGVGGLGFVPGLITTPIIVALLISAVPMAATLVVHRALDVTPLIGIFVMLLSTLVAYGIPILYLRTDIIVLKRLLLAKLRGRQQRYYAAIVEREDSDSNLLSTANEALEYFDKLCSRVDSISNYPHFRRILRYTALALTPSMVTLALKLLDVIGPILSRGPKPP